MRTVCRVRHLDLPLSYYTKKKQKQKTQMSREVLDLAAAALRPGITTDEIDEIVHNATIERNAYPSDLNYRKFPKSVCTSVHSPHSLFSGW
jgi:methionyl aminopeptidase